MNKLLDQDAVQISPSQAAEIGLNNAIFLSVLKDYLARSGQEINGHIWFAKTAENWQKEDFPFWSVKTVRRTIHDLKNRGVIVTEDLAGGRDRTLYLRIS